MKTIFNIAAAILMAIATYGQKMPKDYFDEGIEHVNNEELKKSIEAFKYIVDNYHQDELYPLAVYNVAYIYTMDKQYDNAIKVYEQILASNFNELDQIGGGIMDNPYANYKYKACRDLCHIYTDQENYTKALEYLTLSDTTYPFAHFCGNEGCSNEFSMALNYAQLYEKTGEKGLAIKKAIKYAFREDEDFLAVLSTLLAGQKDIKQKLDNAIANIYTTKKNDVTYFYISFMDVEIAVGNDNLYSDFDKDAAMQKLKSGSFYKMVEKL